MTYQEAVDSYLAACEAEPILASEPGAIARIRRQVEREGLPPAVARQYGVALGMTPLGEAAARVAPDGAADAPTRPAPPPPPVECETCRDGGAVRYEVARDHPLFGQSMPCPACSGAVARREQRERLRKELRTAHPLDSALVAEAKRALETDYFACAIPAGPMHAEAVELAEAQLSRARQAAAAYARTWPGAPLVLVGPPGNGKSTLAAKLYCAAWREGQSAIFRTGWQLQSEAYNFSREAGGAVRTRVLSDYETADLVILDEADHALHGDKLGQGAAALYAIVDARLRAGLPLVLTSNALLAALQREEVGAAILSRLSAAGATWVDMDAVPDARPYVPPLMAREVAA